MPLPPHAPPYKVLCPVSSVGRVSRRRNPTTCLEEISSHPDEQIPTQNVVETGERDVIAGDARPGLLAGDRRFSIEQIVDADPKTGVVGEIP